MAEMLTGIRVVKFMSWEPYFAEKVHQARTKELKYLKGRKYLDAICVYLWCTTPVLISVLTFATYVLLGNSLTAAKVKLNHGTVFDRKIHTFYFFGISKQSVKICYILLEMSCKVLKVVKIESCQN